MRKNKKFVGTWIGEALLIFLSIMLAFYFENYREERSKKTAYLNQLKDFHFDLSGNQGKMEFDLRQPDGVIEGRFDIYDSLLNLLSQKETIDMSQVIGLMRNAETPLAKWFFESPHLDQLMTEYYAFIKNVELKRTMGIHKRRMKFIDQFKDEMKGITQKLHPFYDRLDLQEPATAKNYQIVRESELYNLLLRLDRKVWQLKDQYLMAKRQDSLICLEIEKELALWGESM